MNTNLQNYIQKNFTEDGYDTVYYYTCQLIKEYVKRSEKDYPFSLGLIFGIPHFPNNYSTKFSNKDELCGRIQGYMQLLGMSAIEVDVKGTKVLFELPKIGEN